MTVIAANIFQERMKASFGFPTVAPLAGESFDWANDCFLSRDGKSIEFRAGWDPIEIVDGRIFSAMCDALITWNKRHMKKCEFDEYYGDDPTENGFALEHGADG